MKILVIAPHPDDETLGCGGTLFRHKQNGDELYWSIITNISEEDNWDEEIVSRRNDEIKIISKKYKFSDVFNFSIPTTKVDTIPVSNLIKKISDVYNAVKPDVIYAPYFLDSHTDHQIVGKAIQSTIKWFRYPFIKKVFLYETLSETDFSFLSESSFKPNTYIDITSFMDSKIDAMNVYKSEIDKFPFPRSEKNIRSLAYLRGSQSGFECAESFILLYERIE